MPLRLDCLTDFLSAEESQKQQKSKYRGRIGDPPLDEVQVLDVEAERSSKVLGREKQFVTMG